MDYLQFIQHRIANWSSWLNEKILGIERFKRRYCGWLRNPVALDNGIPFFTLQIVCLFQGMFTIYQLENIASPSTVSSDILHQEYISCCARKSLWTPQSPVIFSVFTAIQRADLTGDVTTFGYFGGLLMAGGTPKSSILVGDFPFESKLLRIHWYRSRADEKKHGCENQISRTQKSTFSIITFISHL